MNPIELTEPIRPTEPEKDDEEIHELRIALAAAITALNKNKNVIIAVSDVRTWSEPEGYITFKLKKTHASWKDYAAKSSAYSVEKRLYDNTTKAEELGIPVDLYIEAKRKFDEYQSKKCEKSPDHEIDYFISKLINSTALIEDQPVATIPESSS